MSEGHVWNEWQSAQMRVFHKCHLWPSIRALFPILIRIWQEIYIEKRICNTEDPFQFGFNWSAFVYNWLIERHWRVIPDPSTELQISSAHDSHDRSFGAQIGFLLVVRFWIEELSSNAKLLRCCTIWTVPNPHEEGIHRFPSWNHASSAWITSSSQNPILC
jgi:hypothetical protein